MGYNANNKHALKGKEKRVKQAQYRVTAKEYRVILGEAMKRGLTVSEYSGNIVCAAAGTARE